MSSVVDHYEALVNLGFKPVPLRFNSKIPVQKNWQSKWNEERIRYVFARNPQYNMGILLGDVVDVEGDSPEANEIINDLVKDCRHPCYESSRSIHHLFLTPVDDLQLWKYDNIEFRGHGHQSVVPPSICEGVEYKWIDQDSFPVPPMPKPLLDLFFSKKKFRRTGKKKLPQGCSRRHCIVCKDYVIVHKKRYDLEIQAFLEYHSIEKWICNSCREVDLRPACRRIKGRNRRVKKLQKSYK